MRPTYRKVPAPGRGYYALVTADKRPVWMCAHTHPDRHTAYLCAKRHVKRLPRTGPAALRRLRERWTPDHVEVPLAEDGRPELRRSWVEDFLQCAQHQDAHSPDAEFGSVIHDAIHAYWQLCLARGEESMLSEVERLVREAFFRAPGADPNRYGEAVDLVQGFCSSRLLEAHRLLVLGRRPAIEHTLRADAGWCWLVGRVDRIDRMDGEDLDDPPRIVRIRDYKTGWQASGGRALDDEAPTANGSDHRVIPHEFQRRFYAQLAFLDAQLGGSLEEVETEIDHIRYRGEPMVITYMRGDLDEWWRGVLYGLAQRWQQRDAPPTGCAACETCALRTTCAASLPEARLVPFDPEGALELAQRWIRTRAMAAGQREALQAFLKERDALIVNGLEVGFLRPHKQQWRANQARALEIVQHLKLAGWAGEAVMYPPGIAEEKVPSKMKAPLVDAGLARWTLGPPAFKSRRVGEREG